LGTGEKLGVKRTQTDSAAVYTVAKITKVKVKRKRKESKPPKERREKQATNRLNKVVLSARLDRKKRRELPQLGAGRNNEVAIMGSGQETLFKSKRNPRPRPDGKKTLYLAAKTEKKNLTQNKTKFL